jgi:hypothetical protein
MAGKTFDQFRDDCVEQISPLQEEFMKLYDINSYEQWFYDHGIGAFHFKADDGRNLYFKYVDVGSYSTKRNTWMWGWNNDSTPRHVSKALEKVRVFGAARHYTELTEGLLHGDEYTGWELTSVTAKVLSAIGMYRIPHEHLYVYFAFTNELTQEEYDALKNKYIACDTHGPSRRAAFVCQHLLGGSNLGFHEEIESNRLSEPEDDYWAWCDACENVWLKEEAWTDTLKEFADMKVVCEECYYEAKRRNEG